MCRLPSIGARANTGRILIRLYPMRGLAPFVAQHCRALVRGSRIPFRAPIPGRAFRYRPQPEGPSRSGAPEWDAVSPRGPIGKSGTGIRLSSGMRFPQQARLGNHGPEFLLHRSCTDLSIEHRCMFALSCMVKLVSHGKRLAMVNKMQRPVGARGGTRT